MDKNGGGVAEKVTMQFALYHADIINAVLPFSEQDRGCLQKHMTKTKNREQLLRILKTFAADPYGNFEFKPR